MYIEGLSAGQFPVPIEDARNELQAAPILGSYLALREGESFTLITESITPRYLEKYEGDIGVVDLGPQPQNSYIFTRTSITREGGILSEWLLKGRDDEEIPVVLFGASTTDPATRIHGVIKAGMRLLCGQVGLAIPDGVGDDGRFNWRSLSERSSEGSAPQNKVIELNRTMILGPVVHVIWPSGDLTDSGVGGS